MTAEEQVIRRYFQTFNRQNIEGLMKCFHENPVLVTAAGKRIEGRAEVRRCYEASFDSFPDGRCQLRTCEGNRGHAVAESRFLGTRRRDGEVVEAIGTEVIEIVDGKIKEIRDRHKRTRSSVKTAAKPGMHCANLQPRLPAGELIAWFCCRDHEARVLRRAMLCVS